MPHRDWSQHDLTEPPDDEDARRHWFAHVFSIALEKLEWLISEGCPAHGRVMERLALVEHNVTEVDHVVDAGKTMWSKGSGYLKGVVAVVVILFFLSAMIANIATAISVFTTGGGTP